MLFVAEGSIKREIAQDQKTAVQAWLGPMVDAGVLQAGWLDHEGQKVWMVLSADKQAAVEERLAHLPVSIDGQVEFEVFRVSALRFR